MKRILTICLLMSILTFVHANGIWEEVRTSSISGSLKERTSTPLKFKTFKFDAQVFLALTENASPRFDFENQQAIVISVPMPNGTFSSFNVYDAELMHPDLAAKFPELRAFVGKGIDDPTADLRIAYSPYTGFSASILSGNHSTVYIDPYTQDLENYIVYHRQDLKKNEDTPSFKCDTPHEEIGKYYTNAERGTALTGDCNLRRYRLAQSCNGEYSQYHIGQAGGTTGNVANDKAIVQAAMNVTMIRVNGVFERDLGITMQFIPNNDLIIYLNAGSDPWNGEYNNTTQNTIDNVIGNANYDIGHNFNTSGGGSAGCIGCVCTTGSKGSGYTGRGAPIGDPFDIDYVAHEMGHQFGGYHTQASSNCRSGSGQTEVEPGSASTIMGYAGICNTNVQNNSDDYFHYVNIRDIVQNINSGVSSACAELITSGNGSPTADAGSDYSIPASTPFILEGLGSDPDDSGLTYCWEQNDPENAGSTGPPTATRTVGPQFRSLDPVTSPVRYMPNLPDVVAGNNPTWEVLNSVSRNMEFAFTVRDNNNVSGCTESDLMSVSVVGSAGPFVVNVPNGGETLATGNNATITWDVANTDTAPINASTVDIFLSTDGGFTYPFTVATGVANTGTANVLVPNQISTTCRMMVRGGNNIFYDISDNNFEIVSGSPNFAVLASPSAQEVCASAGSTTFTVDVPSLNGYTTPVNMTAEDMPAGMTAIFATNPVTPGNDVIVTFGNLGTVTPGTYAVRVKGTSGSLVNEIVVDVTVLPDALPMATLSSPTDGAVDELLEVDLIWNAVSGATGYTVEVATDLAFSNIIASQSLAGTIYTVGGLSATTDYYWRVIADNICTSASPSSPFSFTTSNINCADIGSVDVPISISNGASSTISSNLEIMSGGSISELKVSIDISHSYVGDLSVTITSPSGTVALLMEEPGDGGCEEDDLLVTFDDAAANDAATLDSTCDAGSPAISGTFQSIDPLSVFNGEDPMGTWILEVSDGAFFDGGQLNAWSIDFCAAQGAVSVNELAPDAFMISPNPTSDLVNISFGENTIGNMEIEVFTIDGKQMISRQLENPWQHQLDLSAYSAGIYVLRIRTSEGTLSKKIVKH